MGLDMYAEITADEIATPVDFKVENSRELHRWRKHPDLHGWMEDLYRQKGGSADSFNCVNVMLTREDLDELETRLIKQDLPSTEGFFFGRSDGTETDDDLAFITNARKAINEGYNVYYTSWW